MSYTPTNWKRGDIITSEKLNNMESGIAGAGIIVNITVNEDAGTHEFSDLAIDKNLDELHELMNSGASITFYLHGDVVYETMKVAEYAYYTASFRVENGLGIVVDFYGRNTNSLTIYTLTVSDNDYVILEQNKYILSQAQ